MDRGHAAGSDLSEERIPAQRSPEIDAGLFGHQVANGTRARFRSKAAPAWTCPPMEAGLRGRDMRHMSALLRPGRVSAFAWGVLAYNVAVIAWGAFVRASGSGAGCGRHWPLCNGEVVPRPTSVATVIEATHRATSGLALVGVVGLLVATIVVLP